MPPVVTQLAINGIGGKEDPNAVSYMLPAVDSREIGGTTYQVCAYNSAAGKLVLGKRTLPAGAWTLFHYDGIDQVDLGTFEVDQHNVSVVNIDADGLVHVWFDHHVDPVNYRRSNASVATWTGGLTAALTMLGANESQFTYPVSFRSPVGTSYLIFRDGSPSGGDWFFYVWNDTTDTWAAAAGTGTGGKLLDGKTSGHNPYPDGAPKFTSDWDGAGTGFMHWSWMWRGDGLGDTAVETNHDVCHVRWDGTNWTTMAGSAQTVPITHANAAIALDLGPNAGLLNTNDLDLTSTGRPVIAVLRHDAGAIRQLYALYWNGTAWASQQITTVAAGVATRPFLVIDRATDVAYIIGGHTGESRRDVIQWQSGAGDFTTWTRKVFYSRPLYGGVETNYDRSLWLRDKLITCLITRARASPTNIEVGILETDTAGVDPRTLGGFPGFH